MSAPEQGYEAGFTLLEVLIALVILAVGASGLIGAVRQDLGQQSRLEEKTIAMWVAQNRMAELHAAHAWVPAGTAHETAAMASREWALTVTAATTPNPDMEQIDIVVARSEDTRPVVSLSGYIGRH